MQGSFHNRFLCAMHFPFLKPQTETMYLPLPSVLGEIVHQYIRSENSFFTEIHFARVLYELTTFWRYCTYFRLEKTQKRIASMKKSKWNFPYYYRSPFIGVWSGDYYYSRLFVEKLSFLRTKFHSALDRKYLMY